MTTTDMDPRTSEYMEAARDLWQLHKSLRPIAPMRHRHSQVLLALVILLYGVLSTEEERLTLGALVAEVGSQEESTNGFVPTHADAARFLGIKVAVIRNARRGDQFIGKNNRIATFYGERPPLNEYLGKTWWRIREQEGTNA